MHFTIRLLGKLKLVVRIIDPDWTDGDVAISIALSWK